MRFLRGLENQCLVRPRGGKHRYVPYSLFLCCCSRLFGKILFFPCSLLSFITFNLKIFRFLYLLVLQSCQIFWSESTVQVLALLENNLLARTNYACNLLKLAFAVGAEQLISLHQAKVWQVLPLSWGTTAWATQGMCMQSDGGKMTQNVPTIF